jgi:gas vesicle structural protein
MKPLNLMMVHRAARETAIVDLLDRILDKGIVIDDWMRIFLVGTDMITVKARVVVASIDTYLKYAGPIGLLDSVTWSQPHKLP